MRPLASDRTESLCERYAGKVLLAVFTASQCRFTPQYDGLEALYGRYRERGLVVLGFPSSDFAQEPGSEKGIQSFCRLNHGVRFPMYGKIAVSGPDAHPLYRRLAAPGGRLSGVEFQQISVGSQGCGGGAIPVPNPPG